MYLSSIIARPRKKLNILSVSDQTNPKKRIAVGHPWILVSSSDRGSAVGPLPNSPAKVLPPHRSNSAIQTHPSASITPCRPNALKLVSRVSNTYVKRSVRAKTHHLVVFLRIPGVRGSMDGVGTSFTASPRMMWVRGKLCNRREIPFSGHFSRSRSHHWHPINHFA